jgi:hypothetical protein
MVPPAVLIIEPRREVAAALEDVVNSANFTAVVTPHLERLTDLEMVPAAILLRVAFESVSDPPHAALEKLPVNHPPVVAIAWGEQEIAEAKRLKCDVVLRAPQEVHQLCDVLGSVISKDLRSEM